jgi:hypothetical protein
MEDAVYLAGGSEPARGRAATGAGLAKRRRAGIVDKRITVLSAQGEATLAGPSRESRPGWARAVLRRDSQGKWAICAEAFVEM